MGYNDWKRPGYSETKKLLKMPDNLARKVYNQIRQTRPLPKRGMCQICSRTDQEVPLPARMLLCDKCALDIRKNIDPSNFKFGFRSLFHKGYVCDFCAKLTHVVYPANPYICEYCMKKIFKRQHNKRWHEEKKKKLTQAEINKRMGI